MEAPNPIDHFSKEGRSPVDPKSDQGRHIMKVIGNSRKTATATLRSSDEVRRLTRAQAELDLLDELSTHSLERKEPPPMTNQQNLNYKPPTEEPASMPEGTPDAPVAPAPVLNGTPEENGDVQPPEQSWEETNKSLEASSDAPKSDKTELELLREELDQMKKDKETALKRMSDTKSSFTKSQEELKRLREEIEASKMAPQQSEPETKDSGEGTPPTAPEPEEELDFDALQTEFGWTDEERETFEINPELITGQLKMLRKRMDTGLSERELSSKEARAEKLEAEIEQQEESAWLDRVKSFHNDAPQLIENEAFNVWLKANEPLRASLAQGKEKWDESIAVTLLDAYKDHQKRVEAIQSKRDFTATATRSPEPMNSSEAPESGEKTWAQINAELARASS